MTSFDIDYLAPLLQHWGITIARVFPDAFVAGSPERTLLRTVITDARHRAFILEEISPSSAPRKEELACLLERLARRRLRQVQPYLRDRQGGLVTVRDSRCWQLREYVPGELLPRPEYLEDAWRGHALADFLIALHGATAERCSSSAAESFSIVRFISDFTRKVKRHRPDIAARLQPLGDYLRSDFFGRHDTLPRAFCHGDYHPLNVVWSDTAILSVIDWEFCGCKTEAYDLALLIGCVGVEDPRALKGPLVQSLLSRLRARGLYSEPSLQCLPELVMALRFAWLSEWLRKEEADMIGLELDYLDLLLANRNAVASAWRACCGENG